MVGLSSSAQALTDVIGFDKSIDLVSACNKRKIYIPNSVKKNHWIARAVGLKHANALIKKFGSGYISLPALSRLKNACRNTEIIFRRIDGDDIALIAAEFNISTRQVERIINKN